MKYIILLLAYLIISPCQSTKTAINLLTSLDTIESIRIIEAGDQDLSYIADFTISLLLNKVRVKVTLTKDLFGTSSFEFLQDFNTGISYIFDNTTSNCYFGEGEVANLTEKVMMITSSTVFKGRRGKDLSLYQYIDDEGDLYYYYAKEINGTLSPLKYQVYRKEGKGYSAQIIDEIGRLLLTKNMNQK